MVGATGLEPDGYFRVRKSAPLRLLDFICGVSRDVQVAPGSSAIEHEADHQERRDNQPKQHPLHLTDLTPRES